MSATRSYNTKKSGYEEYDNRATFIARDEAILALLCIFTLKPTLKWSFVTYTTPEDLVLYVYIYLHI